jgi:hypothetical protein
VVGLRQRGVAQSLASRTLCGFWPLLIRFRDDMQSAVSKLQLIALVRPGETYPGGSWKTRREFLDFVVDGRSLFEELVRSRGTDLVSALWLDKKSVEASVRAAQTLMLLRPSELPTGRCSIFICPECGDLGCGAVTAVIERQQTGYRWRDFVLQNDYEHDPVAEYNDVGPFSFDATDYESTLQGAIETLRALE